MKKEMMVLMSVITFLCLIPSASMAENTEEGFFSLALKAGYDFMGKSTIDLNGYSGMENQSGDVKNGYSLSAEGFMNLSILRLGLGISYMSARGIDEDWPEGKFTEMPMYIAANVPFDAENFTPFLAVHVGYSESGFDSRMTESWDTATNSVTIDYGGLYWAIGGGVILDNNLQFELLYKSFSGSISYSRVSGSSGDFNTEYTQMTISAGYRFR